MKQRDLLKKDLGIYMVIIFKWSFKYKEGRW